MPLDKLAIVATQSQFYRKNYRRLLNVCFTLVVICFILLGIAIYQHAIHPTSKYFASTSDGRLIEIKPIVLQ